MEKARLFGQALGLDHPWYVEKTEFDAEARRLDLHLNFERGGLFECGGCGGEGCKAYDTAWKRWRHLNFSQHEAFLHAPAPRVKCPSCGIRRARLPWARPRSGFTLLFEALVVTMAAQMPARVLARIVGEHDTRLWRIVKHYVDEARAAADHGKVRSVGVDEKACRRGHSYVTLFADMEKRRLLYAAQGRKSEVLGEFRADLEAHGGSGDGIRELCMDMSAAYIKGARESFPDAEITFDRFHVVKLLNEAVEKVRRQEQKGRPELKRSRWLWLWNPERRSLRPPHDLDPGPAHLGPGFFHHRVGEGRVGQEHGHRGGALHAQPGAGRAERDVDQRPVQGVDPGPVGAHDADQLTLDVARGGLRGQDHAGPGAHPEPLRQRLAQEGVEAVAVFQVTSVHHLLAQLRERQFGRGVDPDDERRERALGRRRQTARGHPDRSQRRFGDLGLGDRGQRRLHLGRAHAVVQALAVAVPGRVEGDVPRTQAYTRVDPVLVHAVGKGAREDQERETHGHGGGGQGAAAHFAAQVAEREPGEGGDAYHMPATGWPARRRGVCGPPARRGAARRRRRCRPGRPRSRRVPTRSTRP